jgi:hypothetical protein
MLWVTLAGIGHRGLGAPGQDRSEVPPCLRRPARRTSSSAGESGFAQAGLKLFNPPACVSVYGKIVFGEFTTSGQLGLTESLGKASWANPVFGLSRLFPTTDRTPPLWNAGDPTHPNCGLMKPWRGDWSGQRGR